MESEVALHVCTLLHLSLPVPPPSIFVHRAGPVPVDLLRNERGRNDGRAACLHTGCFFFPSKMDTHMCTCRSAASSGQLMVAADGEAAGGLRCERRCR